MTLPSTKELTPGTARMMRTTYCWDRILVPDAFWGGDIHSTKRDAAIMEDTLTKLPLLP